MHAQVIAENIRNGGDLNAMVPGSKVSCAACWLYSLQLHQRRAADNKEKAGRPCSCKLVHLLEGCCPWSDGWMMRTRMCPQVCGIFGFCDIRNFTDATEVLQEDIMEFVNSIARIVHMEVSLHGGFPNKNIGDAFLLV